MIDTHAHLFVDDLLHRIPGLGPAVEEGERGWELVVGDYRWPLREPSLTIDPVERARQLEAAGISLQVVSLSPLWLFTTVDAAVAVPFHRDANDALAAWCAAGGPTLRFVASLPTQDVSAAVAELDRALELGAVGGYLGTSARPGLDDPELDPLYEAAVQRDVPLFLHSTMPGIDAPGDPRLDRWLGGVVIGYPVEETLAVYSLVFGGVLERHPGLDLVISHGGGASALLHGRMRAYSGTARSPIDAASFDRSFRRLWFDTHVHSEEGVRLLASVADPARLVFGSNFGGWDSGSVDEVAVLGDALDDNARRLLRLGRGDGA